MVKPRLESIEKTFVIIKPDGLTRGLVGIIFQRFENTGLKLVAARMTRASEKQARGHYPLDNQEWLIGLGSKTWNNYNNDEKAIKADLGTSDKLEMGKLIYEGLVKYLMEIPLIITVWEGNHAVERVAKIAGKTDPMVAETGTIRGTYAFDTPKLAVKTGRIVFKNLLHISDSSKEAEREIENWFGNKYNYLGDYERIDYIDMLG